MCQLVVRYSPMGGCNPAHVAYGQGALDLQKEDGR
jgi:hypothetical protein